MVRIIKDTVASKRYSARHEEACKRVYKEAALTEKERLAQEKNESSNLRRSKFYCSYICMKAWKVQGGTHAVWMQEYDILTTDNMIRMLC